MNTSTFDKMFNTFKSKRKDNIEKVEFLIQKQVGIIKAGDRYEIKPKRDGKSNGQNGAKQQRGGRIEQARECRIKTAIKNLQGKLSSSLLYLSGSMSKKKKITDISTSSIMSLTKRYLKKRPLSREKATND